MLGGKTQRKKEGEEIFDGKLRKEAGMNQKR
jgi:hypothetical protein